MRYLVGDLAEWTTEEVRLFFQAWPTLRLHGRARMLTPRWPPCHGA